MLDRVCFWSNISPNNSGGRTNVRVFCVLRPCLWDTFSPLYHDRDNRRKALQEIAEAMDIPKEEVTSKWNVLRAQFSREVHSELKLKSGAATSERYKSKWKFLELMKFLTEVVQARKSTDNLVKKEKSSVAAEGGDDTEEETKRKKAKKKGHRSFEDGISHPSCSGL